MSDYLLELSKAKTKKPRSIASRVLKVFFLILIYSSICIGVVGIRKDIADVMNNLRFWLELLIIILLTFFSIVLSVRLTTPGEEKSLTTFNVKTLTILWIVLNTILVLINPSFYPDSFLSIFNGCFKSVFIISFLPATVFTAYSFKKGVLYPKWLGLCIFLLSALSAGIFLQMSCPSGNSFHNLASHIFPVLIVAAIGGLIFKLFLRR